MLIPMAKNPAAGMARGIEALFSDWQAPGRPGGWVAVVREGAVAYIGAFGSPCLEQPAEWQFNTRLRIYSVTMSMTAMSVLIAADRGLLSLNDDIRKHLPELPDYGTRITPHNLLDHSSGLRDNEMVQFLAGFVRASPCSIEYTLELIRRQQHLNFLPGAQMQFSNTNYRLLALILERVTAKPFAHWMAETIFTPLGMQDSSVVPVDGPVIQNLAFGYTPTETAEFWHVPNMNVTTGDGGVISSIRDLIQWNEAIRANSLGIDRLMERMTTRRQFSNGRFSDYGLGVRLGKQNGHQYFGHGGEYHGYSSEFIQFIETDLTVVILANFLDPTLEARLHRVAELALGSPPRSERNPPSRASDQSHRCGWYANADLPLVVSIKAGPEGSFESELMISAALGGLSESPEGDFAPISGYTSTRARFIERAGRRPLLELDGGAGPILFDPVSPEYLSSEEAEQFIGLYGSPELNAVHRVYRRGARLYHLRGLGEWPDEQVREMRLVGQDLFVLDYAEGEFTTLKFKRNRRRQIKQMLIANRDASPITLDRLPDPISRVAAVEQPEAGTPLGLRRPNLRLVIPTSAPDLVR